MSKLNSFLAGVRVLDLSQYIPGPMASLLLADMGAAVLKIEPPNGDELAHLGPRDADGAPVFYGALNAGKSVRRMNLKDAAVREEFLDLVRQHDVLLEGFRPGVMTRLGLDYDTLSGLNPRLIYCSISGYGAAGRLATKAGHDGNYLATSGVLDRNGEGRPVVFDPPVSDTSGSLFAALAILGALHGRNRTGEGCHIDLGLADVMMPLQLMQVADWGANGTVPKPATTYLNGGAAYYDVYATADGRNVMLGSVEPKFWRNFCEAAGKPEWVARQSDPLPQQQLRAEVATWLRALSLKEVLARFEGVDCCLSPVLDLGEALDDADLRARGLVVDAPDGAGLQTLFPARIDGVAPAPRRALRAAVAKFPSRAPARAPASSEAT
jgi:crotonobetainyl-CoA:carnitine CoA-transferase CaiB-like acyl-CoA transferase